MEDLKQLQDENKKLKEEQKLRESVINACVHTWKHTSFPRVLNNALLKVQNLFEESDISVMEKSLHEIFGELVLVYTAQDKFLAELKLIQLKLYKDYQKLIEEVKKSIVVDDNNKKSDNTKPVTFENIVKDVLEIQILAIFFEKKNTIYEEDKTNQLIESFRNEVLITRSMDVIDWFNAYVYSFELDIRDDWTKLSYIPKETFVIVLTNVINNLILNALNYGNKTKEGGYIRFECFEETRDDEEFLTIRVTNPVHMESAFLPATGVGYETTQEIIKVLNDVTDDTRMEDYFSYKTEDNVFTISISFVKTCII